MGALVPGEVAFCKVLHPQVSFNFSLVFLWFALVSAKLAVIVAVESRLVEQMGSVRPVLSNRLLFRFPSGEIAGGLVGGFASSLG